MKIYLAVIAYLLSAPILVGLFEGAGSYVSSRLQKIETPTIAVFRPVKHLYLLYISPWKGQYAQRLSAVSYLLFFAAAGMVIFAGGSIAISAVLVAFAEAVAIYDSYFYSGRVQRQSPESKISGAATRISQLMIAAAGFYCVAGLHHSAGSFLISQISDTKIAPVLYMPSILIGIIWVILYPCPAEMNISVENEDVTFKEKEDAIYKTGRYYQKAVLYSILFLFHYSGTFVSGAISVIICVTVWFLGLLSGMPHSKSPGPEGHAIISSILLFSSFINLLILLKLY